MRSALYRGAVTHVRFRPRRHRLRYRLFMVLLDLDELPELDRRLRLKSGPPAPADHITVVR